MDDPDSYAFYGRSGSGKTTLSASFPKPIILLDVRDRGTKSIRDVKGIKVRKIASTDDFEETYWWLKQNQGKFNTLVIDTMSQLQQIVIEEVAEDKGKPRERAADWGNLSKGDWGDIAAYMKVWITNIRDLPMEVVFIAQDRVFNISEEEDSDNMLDPEIGPRLTPAVASHLNADVSVIGSTFIRRTVTKKKVGGKIKEVKKDEYCMRIGPNAVYITKIRKPKSVKLPDIIVDPTYEKLTSYMRGTSNGSASEQEAQGEENQSQHEGRGVKARTSTRRRRSSKVSRVRTGRRRKG